MNFVFASPLNEGRGLYWMRTDESDNSWTEPVNIFDAALVGWEMIDEPHITQTGNGDFHVIMTRYQLQPDPIPDSLYYIRSQDDGETWSEPALIAKGSISQSQIVGMAENAVVVFWQQRDPEMTQVLSQQSLNSGHTWEQSITLQSTDESPLPSILITPDEANTQIHFAYSNIDENGELNLTERLWQTGMWQNQEEYILSRDAKELKLNDLAAAKMPDGKLMLLWSLEQIIDQEEPHNINILNYSTRLYELPENTAMPQLEPSPVAETSPQVTPPIQTVQATPTIISPDGNLPILEPAPPSNTESSSIVTKILISLAPVLLIIGGLFGVIWLRSRD
jgi:hypothetical protein